MTPLDIRIATWERNERDYLFRLKRPDLAPDERHQTNLRRKEAAGKIAELRHERKRFLQKEK